MHPQLPTLVMYISLFWLYLFICIHYAWHTLSWVITNILVMSLPLAEWHNDVASSWESVTNALASHLNMLTCSITMVSIRVASGHHQTGGIFSRYSTFSPHSKASSCPSKRALCLVVMTCISNYVKMSKFKHFLTNSLNPTCHRTSVSLDI